MKNLKAPRMLAAILFAVNILWTIFDRTFSNLVYMLIFNNSFSIRDFFPRFQFVNFIHDLAWIFALALLIVILFMKLRKEFLVAPAVILLLPALIGTIQTIVNMFDNFSFENLFSYLFYLSEYVLFGIGIIAFVAIIFLGKKFAKVNKFYFAPGALMLVGSLLAFVPIVFEIFKVLFEGYFSIFFSYLIVNSAYLIGALIIDIAFIFAARYATSDDESLSGMMFRKKKID